MEGWWAEREWGDACISGLGRVNVDDGTVHKDFSGVVSLLGHPILEHAEQVPL